MTKFFPRYAVTNATFVRSSRVPQCDHFQINNLECETQNLRNTFRNIHKIWSLPQTSHTHLINLLK